MVAKYQGHHPQLRQKRKLKSLTMAYKTLQNLNPVPLTWFFFSVSPSPHASAKLTSLIIFHTTGTQLPRASPFSPFRYPWGKLLVLLQISGSNITSMPPSHPPAFLITLPWSIFYIVFTSFLILFNLIIIFKYSSLCQTLTHTHYNVISTRMGRFVWVFFFTGALSVSRRVSGMSIW